MKKRVISWLLTIVMVLSLLPTSVLADTLVTEQEQTGETVSADTESTVSTEDEETQEQQEPAAEVPAPQSARSGGTDSVPKAISDADGFKSMVADGNYKLTTNITVTEPYANDFSGTFDGNGHTVTLEINQPSKDNIGLFSKISSTATVKNVTVDGTVTGSRCVGGIAGTSNGTITQCQNKAAITATKNGSGNYSQVGGIVGYAENATITSCANVGAVNADPNDGRRCGGVVGYAKTSVIENCYNQGQVSSCKTGSSAAVGGIAGYIDSNASVKNCYNSGAISCTATSQVAKLVGWNAGSTIENCYYLGDKAGEGANGYNYTDPTQPKTADEMKSTDFVALLNGGEATGAFMAKAGDYPALSWETPTAPVTFTISPANATLEINGAVFTGSCTVNLPAGTHSYTVSCPGYTTQTGSVSVNEEQANSATPIVVGPITLVENTSAWVNVTFAVTPANAVLTVKQGDMTVEPQSGTTYKLLKDVEYTYTADSEDESYEPASGTITPSADTATQSVTLKKVAVITLKGSYKTEYEQRDELDTNGLIVTVTYTDGTTRDITEGFTVTGFDSTNAVESQTLTVTYRGATAPYTIKINEKLFPSTVFNSLKGYATVEYSHNSSYTGEDGKEFVDEDGTLVSNNKKTKNASVTITITFLEDIKTSELTFDYRISSESSDKVTIKKNSEQLLSKGGTVDWTNQTIEVKAGDEVTITYAKDYSVDTGSDCVWLKNFAVSPLYTLTITTGEVAVAAITLKDADGKTVSGSNGVYAVKPGKYTYTITKKGYETATGTITMPAGDHTENVTLVKLPVITLTVVPADAKVTMKKGTSTASYETKTDGVYTYIADRNTAYTYTVEKFGYVTQTDTISVVGSDVTRTVELETAQTFGVDFRITRPEGVEGEPTIIVKSGSIQAYSGNGTDCRLPAGTYTYTAVLDGCDALSGSFEVKADKTVVLEFVKSLTFDDFFAGLKGITAENGTQYGFNAVKNADGNYLESGNKGKSSSSATMTLSAEQKVNISFEYRVSSENKYDKFTAKVNSKSLLEKSGNLDWDKFSVVLDKEATLTLAYGKDGSGNSYDDVVQLKNFTVSPVYTISLNVTGAEDYTAVLRDAKGTDITGTDGNEYAVPAGMYTYTVSQYGYRTETGTIIVTDKDVSQNVTLTALTAYQVTFNVTPADAAVTLTHPAVDTIEADENGAYTVYAGETYAYTVAKADYITVSGSFTAAKNDTVTVELTYAGEGWDGTAKTAPAQDENGVYQIGTAAELAWFADAVNNGRPAISGKLTANINLNGKTWTAIGTESNKFAGTLDGDEKEHYIVNGLKGAKGLFDYVDSTGKVKNLSVDAVLTANGIVGGIVDFNDGTVENCLFSGSVTNSSNWGATGGIVGKSEGKNSVVRNCVNTGSIKNTTASYGSTLSVGGIVGYTYGKVENCYSVGEVYADPTKTTNKAIGGIAGAVNGSSISEKWGSLINCYVIGTVTGPESGIGAVVGTVGSGTSVTNCAYLDTVAPQAAADGTTNGMTACTADYMRSAEFAVDMNMNQDDGTLNSGFPVLPWQGGTVLSADDLRAVSQAQQSLSLQGMTAADKAKQKEADWYAKNIWEMYQPMPGESLEEMLAELRANFDIEKPEEGTEDLKAYYTGKLREQFYEEQGLDPVDPETLTPDAFGVYQIKGIEAVTITLEDMLDDSKSKEEVCTTSVMLPSTVQVTVNGEEKTVAIAWESSNTALVTVQDDGTAAITAPEGGKVNVTLTATLTSGTESKVKTFTLCLWSEAAEQQQTLDDIAAVITARNAAVRPLQGLGIYNDTSDANSKGVEKAFRRLLEEMGYEDVAAKATITYTDGSAEASGFDGTEHVYITEEGDVNFFDGATLLKAAYYSDLEFKVAYGGAEKTITLRAVVGRSFDDVQAQLTEAAKTLDWDMIRGENTNEVKTDTTGAWDRHAVQGGITSNLTLPYSISGRYDMKVQWGVDSTECLYVSGNEGSTSGVGNVVRPVRPAEGDPDPDTGKVVLIARVTYKEFDDDPYIKEHITGQNGVEVYADVFFDITVAPFDIDVTNEMQTALAEKYQSLLVDFVDKTTKPDLSMVDADLQMPRPYLLQREGILTDSYNQHVTMTSLTPDVLDFNGYHAVVYRPLPGKESVVARYVVSITTRGSSQLLARQEFSFTIQPLEQSKLDDAAAFMKQVCTEDVYWNGIKDANTDKNKVTSDLDPFVEIRKNKDGTLEYIRGAVNMNFDGIEADDIDGWMASEKFRTFYSSRPSVIEHELLRVHQPEYNTKVELNSVLTYTKYAQYWEKFGLNGTEESKEEYKDFKQFYKQPVSVELTVAGSTGRDDPNENTLITVTVQVDGYSENGLSFTGTSYRFTGKASEDWTAWDAVKACLESAGYEYGGSGAYLESVTDAKGSTLGEKSDGKSSGWMFGVTPAQGVETLPNTTLDATFIHDGDTVRLFFTNKYIPVGPDEPVDPGTEIPNFDKVYADTKKYIQNNVPAPIVASDRGEWAVLGLARAGVTLSDEYIQAYYDKVVAYVQSHMGDDGVLFASGNVPTITDNERIILALTAIGKDPANVGGANLLTALQDKNIMKVDEDSDTDINGLVFGLLALNSGNYTQDSYWLVQAILDQQNENGSWSANFMGKPTGDVDMTAMALQALAPYYNEGDNDVVNAAVDKALEWLSDKYKNTGYTSAESCAQVVVALSALQLNANSDSRFVKTVDDASVSVMGNLLQYYIGEGQGFKHDASNTTANQKATEQALYAMAAYERYCQRTNALYDMTDAACAHSFGEWKVVAAATCTADGSRQRVCTRCGKVEAQTLPATGHSFGEWTVDKQPTCTETGTEKRICAACNKVETRVIAVLGHTPGTVVSVDKDYHWQVCAVCEAEVNKVTHTYVNGIQCVCGVRKGAEGDVDTTIKRVVVSNEITFVLADNDKLNTPDKVKAELQLQITLKNSKSNKDNTVFMDVSLRVLENNEWRPATKEDLTDGKITVLLPYPEAVAAKYSQYNFTVAHMVAMEGCGKDVGTVEFPSVNPTKDGLWVTLTGLSPVAVSWTAKPSSSGYYPSTPAKADSANTADDSQMVLWLGSAALAAAAVVVLTRRQKRTSK